MLVKSENGLLLLNGERRNTTYGERLNLTFIDIENGYSRIQANVEEDIFNNRPPNNTICDVTFRLDQANYRLYANVVKLEESKTLATTK